MSIASTRFSQAQVLIAALFSVVLTGRMTIVGDQSETSSQSISKLPRGTYSAIARKLGVTPSHVSNVDKGLRHSATVETELEIARAGGYDKDVEDALRVATAKRISILRKNREVQL